MRLTLVLALVSSLAACVPPLSGDNQRPGWEDDNNTSAAPDREPERDGDESDVCWSEGSGAGFDATGTPCDISPESIRYSLLGPNVRLVVDKSGSMAGDKWSALLGLTPYLPAVGARANLGLSTFPGPGGGCSVRDNELVDMTYGPEAADPVADALYDSRPRGSTPMAKAIRALVGEEDLQCTNRDNVVVLLTDGEESCQGNPYDAVEDLTGQGTPVELYVIGFGTTEQQNRSLQRIAAAASATTHDNFFAAASTEDLVARLASVTGTCILQLEDDIDEDALIVSMDGTELAPCTEDRCTDGYTVDVTQNTVKLEGADCLAVQDGTCHDLVFTQD